MFVIIENIGITLLVAGVLTFVTYFLAAQFKNGMLGLAHYVCLGLLFLMLSYQTYRFIEAWNAKTAIEETLAGINSWADDALDFINEVDKQNGGNGQSMEIIRDAMNNPLIQKGLNLFGINVGGEGQMTVEMGEKLKSEYNWYMFRRVCW